MPEYDASYRKWILAQINCLRAMEAVLAAYVEDDTSVHGFTPKLNCTYTKSRTWRS